MRNLIALISLALGAAGLYMCAEVGLGGPRALVPLAIGCLVAAIALGFVTEAMKSTVRRSSTANREGNES